MLSYILASFCPQHSIWSSKSNPLPPLCSLYLAECLFPVIKPALMLVGPLQKLELFCLSLKPSASDTIMTDRALTMCLTRCAALHSPTVLSLLTDQSCIPPSLFLLPSG